MNAGGWTEQTRIAVQSSSTSPRAATYIITASIWRRWPTPLEVYTGVEKGAASSLKWPKQCRSQIAGVDVDCKTIQSEPVRFSN